MFRKLSSSSSSLNEIPTNFSRLSHTRSFRVLLQVYGMCLWTSRVRDKMEIAGAHASMIL